MNRRFDALAQQMDVMMQFNAQFSSALSQIFSASVSSSAVQFPIYPNVPAYPPSASSTEDSDGDDRSSSQGSPQF